MTNENGESHPPVSSQKQHGFVEKTCNDVVKSTHYFINHHNRIIPYVCVVGQSQVAQRVHDDCYLNWREDFQLDWLDPSVMRLFRRLKEFL